MRIGSPSSMVCVCCVVANSWLAAYFVQLRAIIVPGRRRSAQQIRIETDFVADVTGVGSAKAQMHGSAVIGVAGHDPNRPGDACAPDTSTRPCRRYSRFFCCAVVGLIQMALSQVILFWGLGSSCSQPLLANDPSQMVGSGRKMISIPCADLGWRRRGHLRRDVHRRQRGVWHHAVVQRLLPEDVEVRNLGLALPIRLHQIVIRFVGLAGQRGDHFECRLAAIERSDQRLDETDRSVEAANIAPRFQIMRFRNIPDALPGGLIGIQAQISLPTRLFSTLQRNPDRRARCKPDCRRG